MEESPTVTAEPEDALTTDRKGVRIPRVEIIARNERRRVWTLEQKREVVAESLGPDLTPTEVARKYGISSGLLYAWRRRILGEQLALVTRARPAFTQVEMAATSDSPSSPAVASLSASAAASRPSGLIEIVLPTGITLRVDAEIDETALRRVLTALSAR